MPLQPFSPFPGDMELQEYKVLLERLLRFNFSTLAQVSEL